MKKSIISLLAMIPLLSFGQGGQFTGTGYYRVQNVDTKRYFSIVDDKNTSVGYGGVGKTDLRALQMLTGFESKVAYNPATICYVEKVGQKYNIKGQGLDLYQLTGRYLDVDIRTNGTYRIGGSTSGVSIYLRDYTVGGQTWPSVLNGGSSTTCFWYFLPIDQSATQYFGVKPEVQASATGDYWGTMYAGFAFKPSDANTKVYYVDRVVGSYAIIHEVTDVVPEDVPVVVRCSSAAPSDNKLTLYSLQGKQVNGNQLVGNYYCNYDANDEDGTHTNLTAYNPNVMRLLGTTADGKPAFVKSSASCVTFSGRTGYYLPANKCWLRVSTSAPDELLLVTEEEYTAGVDELTLDGSKAATGKWYDLQGRQVSAPGKGLYIRDGKKIVVK